MKLQSNGSITTEMLGKALYEILKKKIPYGTCKDAIAELRDRIKSAVGIYGMTVSVRGFGTLGIKKLNAKKARNVGTGDVIIIPECDVPAFKPSKEWKEMVNMIDSKKRHDVQGVYKPQEVFLGHGK